MEKMNITIDGKSIQCEPGKTILDIAEDNQIYIPRLCYHKKLLPVGACRICIVEVEGMRKPITACSTPVIDKMVIRTNSEEIKKMRRIILELLFGERNHFCSFCEVSGGDCELQLMGYQYEMDHIRFPYQYPKLSVDSSGLYFVLDHNRCILCSRCIRYCDEIEGMHTLDISYRGAKAIITIDLAEKLENSSCTSCGGCVQVCPTGALFNKLSAYRGKKADCQNIATICQKCSLGCGIKIYKRGNHIVEIDGDYNAPVNQGHLCVKGRYEPILNHTVPSKSRTGRIADPLVIDKGSFIKFSWDKALEYIATGLRELKSNPDSIFAYITPGASNESIYSFFKLFRETIGTSNAFLYNQYEYDVYARCSKIKNREFGLLNFESDISRIEESDCIVIIGADPAKTHKVLGASIRRQVNKKKAELININIQKTELDIISNNNLKITPGSDGILLNAIINLIIESGWRKEYIELANNIKGEFNKYKAELAEKHTGISRDKIIQISKIISQSKNPVFIYGRGLTKKNDSNLLLTLLNLVRLVGKLEKGKLAIIGLRHGANARGGYEIDKYMEEEKEKISSCSSIISKDEINCGKGKFLYLALGDDEINWTKSELEKLSKIEFLVIQTGYPTELMNYAKVILPSTVWYEKSGSMTNIEGQLQYLHPVLKPLNSIKDDYEIFHELEERINGRIPDIGGISVDKIHQEMMLRRNNYLNQYYPDKIGIEFDELPLECIPYLDMEKGE